jgi:hypothetical protein
VVETNQVSEIVVHVDERNCQVLDHRQFIDLHNRASFTISRARPNRRQFLHAEERSDVPLCTLKIGVQVLNKRAGRTKKRG